MKTKMKKMMMLAVAAVLMLSLAACSGKSSNSKEPSNLDEAVAMYQELMEQENQIFAKNKKLWEKVFMEADKGMTLQEDGKNYGEFLLDTIESAKDKFTEDELKTLKSGAEEIKKIEEKLTMLEEKYPKVAEKAKENGSTSCKDGSTSVPADSGNMGEFPAFEGKDLDGKKVSSKKLFSGNKVTVINFWFTTCKPCVGELKDMEALNKKLMKKGGEVVGVNAYTLDGDKKAIADAKKLLEKKGVSYKNIWFKSDSAAGKLTSGMYSFPTTYVIDSKGKVVGKPIVGSITSDEQKKAPNDLIEQAMKKSEESKGGAFAPANAPPSLYRKFFVFGLGGRPHVVSGMFHSHPHGICRFVSAGNRQNESYYITGILPCQHLILPGIINQQPNAVI